MFVYNITKVTTKKNSFVKKSQYVQCNIAIYCNKCKGKHNKRAFEAV